MCIESPCALPQIPTQGIGYCGKGPHRWNSVYHTEDRPRAQLQLSNQFLVVGQKSLRGSLRRYVVDAKDRDYEIGGLQRMLIKQRNCLGSGDPGLGQESPLYRSLRPLMQRLGTGPRQGLVLICNADPGCGRIPNKE